MDITEIIVDVLTAIEIGFITAVALRVIKVVFFQTPEPDTDPDLMFVCVEEVLTGDTSIYLISDADTNQFICQGNSADEVKEKLTKLAGTASVILVAGNGEKYRLKL